MTYEEISEKELIHVDKSEMKSGEKYFISNYDTQVKVGLGHLVTRNFHEIIVERITPKNTKADVYDLTNEKRYTLYLNKSGYAYATEIYIPRNGETSKNSVKEFIKVSKIRGTLYNYLATYTIGYNVEEKFKVDGQALVNYIRDLTAGEVISMYQKYKNIRLVIANDAQLVKLKSYHESSQNT